MKRLKSFVSFVLALAMVFAMTTTAFAAETGSIEIVSPDADETYDIYLMFELESYNSDNGAYSYVVNSEWEYFVTTGAGSDYVEINDAGYVVWKTESELRAEEITAFAKAALQYAEDHNITPVVTLPKDTSYVAQNLTLGYYLVDSSLGTICGLTTTQPDAKVEEKNTEPTSEKEVYEDVDGNDTFPDNQWGTANDAEIGDTVRFQTTIKAYEGAVNYVLHDTMSEGLTFDTESVSVKVGETYLTEGTDYTVSTDCEDDCTFEIVFTKTYLDSIKEETEITITYSAVLNEKAVIYLDANTNTTYLSYGDENKSKTTPSTTKTYTYKFDIVKTKEDGAVLEGAEFKLYDAATGGNEISVVVVNAKDNIYRVATDKEISEVGFEAAVIKAGMAEIQGLDSGTYYLEETKAPDGYNKLTERIAVTISGGNLDTTMTDGVYEENDGGIQIINKTGAELPSTGGIGTTVFYVIGGILVVGAAVLLVSKKRMGNEE